MNTAAYVLNRTGPASIRDKTPCELWCGENFNLHIDHIRIFGLYCLVHIPKERRRKWDSKSEPGKLVGYHEDGEGYWIYAPKSRRIRVSKDIVLTPEQATVNQSRELPVNVPTEVSLKDKDNLERSDSSDDELDMEPEKIEENVELSEEDEEIDEDQLDDEILRRSKRNRRQPEWLHGENRVLLAQVLDTSGLNPRNFRKVMEAEDSVLWKRAIEDELESFSLNKV